jgi:flagellar assembly protein FliH
MNSSYKNSKIIKGNDVIVIGKKTLKNNTNKLTQEEIKVVNEAQGEEFIKREEEIKLKLIEAEQRYEQIIKKAQEERFKIIEASKSEALGIEKKAYEQGHNQGLKNGYEDGYKEAYEDNIEKAKLEASEIIENANDTLFEAKEHVLSYMKENKERILDLSISIAEQVLREKFNDTSSMNSILINIIEEYELKENVVVKVNPLYKESLDNQIIELKENYKINGDVFILSDESIKQGNAVIDTLKGRLIIGIDTVLDKIKEELL